MQSANASLPLATALLLFACGSSPSLAADRGLSVVTTASGETVPLYSTSHALIIGVSDYSGGWEPLPGVASDVTAVRKALESHGFETDVLMNGKRGEIMDALTQFRVEHTDSDSRLLVYYAGHGHTTQDRLLGEQGFSSCRRTLRSHPRTPMGSRELPSR